MEQLQREVEEKIAALDPKIELVSLERTGKDGLRLRIDHPGGVDLALCERVNNHLRGLTTDWSLEVSSPGLDRPLTRLSHYRRFLGSRVRVRTREEIEGRKSFTGRLEAANERNLSVTDGEGTHEIPLASVHRSNVVHEFSEVSQ